MKRNYFLLAASFLLTAFVGCSSEDDATNPSPFDPTQTVTKVSIIDPIGYAQNMGAWIPATATEPKKLLLEEGQHYLLGVICEPSTVKSPVVNWTFVNTQFEEAAINAQGIITGLREDPGNVNKCLIIATSDNNFADTIEVCVLKEISGVYEIINNDRDIVITDGASKRSTARVTKASNASGTLNNKDLITGFFSDKNRANFNDAVTITFTSGTSFDIQGNGLGVNILMTYSKAYITTPAGTAYFDNVRDYSVLTCTSRRQALMVDSSYVSLNNHNLHINSGETFQYSATLTAMSPLKQVPVKYASSDPTIASVDASGKVTAHKRGLASVIAFTNHLAEAQYCVVNVDEVSPAAVTRIIDVADPTTAHTVSRALIVKGQTKQLYADANKDEMTVATGSVWSSSDPSVVTVDANGLVTAVAPGSAAIFNTPYVEDANGVRSYGISDCSCFTVMPDYTTAKVGDIFYEDGSFSTTPLLSGKTPIGIIAYLNCNTSGEAVVGTNELCESGETGQYGAIGAANNFHGLVIGLNDATTGVKWGKDAAQTGLVGVTITKDDATLKGTAGTGGNMSGYNAAIYTNAMHVVDGSQTFVPSEAYPASYAAWNYNISVPSFCTGWFIPTAPQWYNVLYNGLGNLRGATINPVWDTNFDASTAITNINNKLSNIGAATLPTANFLIWTSNEGNDTGTDAAVLYNDGTNTKFFNYDKTQTAGPSGEQTYVRPFFAF